MYEFIVLCLVLVEYFAMAEELQRLQKQVALQSLFTNNTMVLSGTEDSLTRQKWGSLMTFKISHWDFKEMAPDLLFAAALEGKAWAEYQALTKAADEDAKAFATRVVAYFSKEPELRPAEVSDFLAGLRSRRLLPGESFEEAYARLKREISRLPWGDKEKQSLLLSSYQHLLPGDVINHLRQQEKLPVDEYFNLSKLYLVKPHSGAEINYQMMESMIAQLSKNSDDSLRNTSCIAKILRY